MSDASEKPVRTFDLVLDRTPLVTVTDERVAQQVANALNRPGVLYQAGARRVEVVESHRGGTVPTPRARTAKAEVAGDEK